MNPRIRKVISLFGQYKVHALLVTKDVNIRYLTGFPAADSWLLITRRKTYYITDFRYILEAKKKLKGIFVFQYPKSMAESLVQLAGKEKAKFVGFDSRFMSLAQYRQLMKRCASRIQLRNADNLVESMRAIKDPAEIAQIKKAIKLNLQAYSYIKNKIKPGLTERDIYLMLENYVRERGATFSFDPIIASGPNSCYPHAKVTDRKIKNNEPVLIDMGIELSGYKSDLTRMFFLGKIPRFVKEVETIVRAAQERAIKKIRANIPAKIVDQEARNYLEKYKLGKYFGHSLGHGVGLEIHENPRISQTSPTILENNMIITVEPAAYIPYRFGIRIEDMVRVTDRGCEVLSR